MSRSSPAKYSPLWSRDSRVSGSIEQFADTTGIRDLEQAAEHIAANALYQIEVNKVSSVTFDAEMVKKLFE